MSSEGDRPRRPGPEEEHPVPPAPTVVKEEDMDEEERLAAEEEGEDTFESFDAVRSDRRGEDRRTSYSERVRNWGEKTERKPEESASQSLLPPPRRVSGTGEINNRLSVPLVAVPAELDPLNPASTEATGAAGAPAIRRAPSALRRQGDAARRIGASTVQGKKTVRLSVLPVSGTSREVQNIRASAQAGVFLPSSHATSRAVSFAPKRLLDIENGKSILVTDQRFLPPSRYQELDTSGALVVTARSTAPQAQDNAVFFADRASSLQDRIRSGDIRDFESNTEIGILGTFWRYLYKRNVLRRYDYVNGARISRQLQLFMPLQTGYEAYILSQIIEAMDNDRRSDVIFVLNLAFRNRNVSRILVQIMRIRYDFWWHWYQQITWNRWYEMFGQIPIIGYTRFPPTENFPPNRVNAQNALLRIVLGQGNWITRVIAGGRQGLVTDDPNNTAQNLAAESNGFEFANRSQWGTYIGRRKTNEFRFIHRLPTDESIVRTFVTQPQPTLLNNGTTHVLRQLAKHWHNMLFQYSGNFAHQRQEQLNPFETLRFNMPVVCLLLSNARGRNLWDSYVLGPFMRKLQELKPTHSADTCRYLIREMQENIMLNLTAGVAGTYDALRSWLDAISRSCDLIEEEAKKIYEIVTSVEIGIRLGYDLITQISWKIPSDAKLKKAILSYINGNGGGDINERRIRTAMYLTTPRDKRTLIELVKNGLTKTKPAQLLLGRVKTLLQRELRRELLNEAIRELSMGDYVTEVLHDEWYWLEEHDDKRAAYIYDAKVTGRDLHRFIHIDSGFERFVSLSDGSIKARSYVPVAEAITRAQKAFMTIELDHGTKFSLDAFMEFSFLRIALRRLIVISQITCEELDNARLNLLREIQRSNQSQVSIHELEVGQRYYTYNAKDKVYEPFLCEKKYTSRDREWSTLARTKIVRVPPQSMIVIGGGPTGMMTVVHCTENVLISGGVMKLYEARDAFDQGGSTFERAQIVRLDARWIAMLRYHLGTGFEDVYIPASGETDSQLGNTLPQQGFVEITIKDLENMLHVEISKLWSKGLISVYTDSASQYDSTENALTKFGASLKIDDLILRRVDQEGHPAETYFTWKVVDLVYSQALALDDLRVGSEYAIYIRLDHAVEPFKLTAIDLSTNTYTFKALTPGKEDVKATGHNLPSIYPKGTTRHADVQKVVVESVVKGLQGGYVRDELDMNVIRKQKFKIDVGHTHVVEAIGKPHGSKVHFSTTTYEPYGVCCIQGLKVSMGMHNFGERRWKTGIVDDIRSITDTNTRIIGDFTKMVRSAPIANKMYLYISDKKDPNWRMHFEKLVMDSPFPELNQIDPIVPKVVEGVRQYAADALTYRRQTLQTRFFETGDNYYLGMEFTREYDLWKNKLVESLVAPLSLKAQDAEMKGKIGKFKGVLGHHIDRLWYDAVLEVIRTGDVYAPGARKRVPRLYLINSYVDTTLGKLPVGESFRLKDRPEEKYEVVVKGSSQVIVRNVEGYISKMSKNTFVKREGNLTRAPDGNQESRVCLATFPVGHYVNFRCMRLNDSEKGYVFAFVGDEQSTPHFMRYSGLTGACINAMFFNNFIKRAIDGVPFLDRIGLYCIETNWSNGEVVQRGTGANYGEDGFLRPGFPYAHGLDYLRSKIIEHRESNQDLKEVLSRDWKIKFAAALVPRGMELNENFIRNLYHQLQTAVMENFIREAKADKRIGSDALESALRQRATETSKSRDSADHEIFWLTYLEGLELDDATKKILNHDHVFIAKTLEQTLNQIIEYATRAYLNNERISSELFNQPKSVDSITEDFAAEAQNFANALLMNVQFTSFAVSLLLVDARGRNPVVSRTFAGLVGALNIFLAFGTMTNVTRYKIRNEEFRIIWVEEKFLQVKKAVFSVMDRQAQDTYDRSRNPFVVDLDKQVDTFLKNAKYYDYPEPKEFNDAYAKLIENVNDPNEIREFMELLTGHFIPDVYHVNSYLQEYLVRIYRTLDEMLYFLTTQVDRRSGTNEAQRLFDRLYTFEPLLQRSLQTGPVKYGFLKTRKIYHWDVPILIRFFYSMLCFSSARGRIPCTPIETETLGIIKATRNLSKLHGSQVLRREIRDLDQLYWATRESAIASMIFISGVIVFLGAVLFTIGRIFVIDILNTVAYWFNFATALAAAVASFHFVRKTFILTHLWWILGGKISSAASTDDRDALRRVRRVTSTQIYLTLVRLVGAVSASVALSWNVAESGFTFEINTGPQIPLWIAVGSISTAFVAAMFFFFVEYFVRYNLPPKLGEYVCEAFRDEIEAMYKVLSIPINDVDAKQVQERTTWEYVAREFLHKYRFDTVFAADRFGAILQYIQSGMDPR